MTAQSNGSCDNYPHNEMRKRGWLSLGRRNANGEANETFGGGPEKGEGKEYGRQVYKKLSKKKEE